MLKKLSLVTASIVAFAFVFVSIVHACSGLASMNPAMQQDPIGMGSSDAPCSKEKPDICKSVRDSMLSVKPSLSAPEQTAAQAQLSIEKPFVRVPKPAARVIEVGFRPVYKLPLTFSYLVLRI